jgi:hypothetical protein
MYAQGGPEMERPISDIASMVNQIFTFVRREAQGKEIAEVERYLLSLVMAVGRAALEEFVAVKGSGYAGKEIVDGQGNRRPYVRDRSCAYRSTADSLESRCRHSLKPRASRFELTGREPRP